MQWPEVHNELTTRSVPENPIVACSPMSVTIGKPLDWPTYGWDNEYGKREMHVPAFEASKYQVTNGEFLEFVKAGGYRQEQFWSPEGWKW
jgi:formylglycine-generating enzyme required for sulfatase activity